MIATVVQKGMASMRRISAFAASGVNDRHWWRVWRRPRTVAAAAFGALLLGWGTASALSGPEPVPDTYGGQFVLSTGAQLTEVENVSGCDMTLGPTGGGTIVKPCQFDVPANAAPKLKQRIVAALTAASPGSNTFTLTHYGGGPDALPMSDYAATGDFTISQVTLPVLDPIHDSPLDSSVDDARLRVELTPVPGHVQVEKVAAMRMPDPSLLPAAAAFHVGTGISCGSPSAPTSVPVTPPVVQIGGFTTTVPRSLTVSVDTSSASAPVVVDVGSVRISQSDSTGVGTARNWIVSTPGQRHTLTVTMASYNCATGVYANQFKMSLPVYATSMDPFPRTDGFFKVGLASALGSQVPTVSWQ